MENFIFCAVYFVLAVLLNCKNARVIFIFKYCFENWILNFFQYLSCLHQILEFQVSLLYLKRNYSMSLSDSKGFNVFQKLSLSITFFSSKFLQFFFLVFFKRDTYLLLCLNKAFRFFYFIFWKGIPQLWPIIISLEKSFVIKGIWLALTNFFLIGAKLFTVSILVLQNLLKPLSLLT